MLRQAGPELAFESRVPSLGSTDTWGTDGPGCLLGQSPPSLGTAIPGCLQILPRPPPGRRAGGH